MSEPPERFSSIDPMFSGFVLDPAKCSQLKLEEKRELVHEIAQWSKDAPEMLKSFTRRELLEIICVEMGKVRKYTGYTKSQMIDHLLNLVSQNPKTSNTDNSAAKTQIGKKRQRNIDPPNHILTDFNYASPETKKETVRTQFCENLVCKAPLNSEDAFCKRCSCCICRCYDDNKDPSLWLTCGSDPADENDSCGMSCHLECALKHERTGIMKSSDRVKLDGSFYCVSCGKVNGLMRSWRKQLLIAKEARRVDVLCLRISLGHKILIGTKRYNVVQKILQMAVNILTSEVGPLHQVCLKMARGIVNRLSCGAEVQRLCTSALESFDLMLCVPNQDLIQKKETFACQILFEESSPTSVTIVLQYDDHLLKDFLGCRLWHRKSEVKDYQDQPTFIVLRPEKRFKIADLLPSTEYCCKVSLFSSAGILGIWDAKWVTPKSHELSIPTLERHGNEDNMIIHQFHSHIESFSSSDIKLASQDHLVKNQLLSGINKTEKGVTVGSLPSSMKKALFLMSPIRVSPSTPCKLNGICRAPGFLSCKKQMEEPDYEYSVRVIKWLEHEGHIDEDFRVKFLTWFSLKASMQERRVVSAFVDALIDDPPSLVGQLIHTFMDDICCDQKQVSQRQFCTRLWH